MTAEMDRYADFEGLRAQAVALRREGLSLRQIRDRLKTFDNDLLQRLVEGGPPPEWTRRPDAKDDLRDRARELRLRGMTRDRIQVEPDCSKSSISLWVRDLPKADRRTPAERGREAARERWVHDHPSREAARTAMVQEAEKAVGEPTARELFLAGVALHRADGSKSKPYRRDETVAFVNSDPDVIRADRAQEHGPRVPGMPRRPRLGRHRLVPSHRRLPVRHSRGGDRTRCTKSGIAVIPGRLRARRCLLVSLMGVRVLPREPAGFGP
ncbi:hypothetical protein GCM10010363_48040 [Streptomyces omiyaensis]|nr:hypothetical protein GCM10010363_48040 [Streptomyces omiyaensis]